MSNRQTLPQSISPVNGDVESAIGSPTVTVVGIQGVPFSSTLPQPQQIPVMGSDGQWHPEDPIVSGTDAPGSPSSANPVQVAGWDNVLVRELLTDPQGAIVISSSAGIGELLQILIQEIRALKIAIIAQDSTLNPIDFEAADYSDLTNSETALS